MRKNNYQRIKSLQEEGKLRLKGAALTKKTYDTFIELTRLVQELYGEDWDFIWDDNTAADNIQGYLLHFPEVKMTNSTKKSSHIIRDLFIELRLTNNLTITGINGLRGTLTYAEYSCGYLHSHLRGTDPTNNNVMGGNFCLGSGEINIYMSEYNTIKSKETFLPLLLQLFTLASYESLEGVPFRKFGEIKERFMGKKFFESTPQKVRDYARRAILNAEGKISFNINVTSGYLYVVEDAALNKYLDFPMTAHEESLYLCYRDENGHYVTAGGDSSPMYPLIASKVPKIYFKDKLWDFKIINIPGVEDREEETTVKGKLHPTFKQLIIKELESILNEKWIAYSVTTGGPKN